MAVNPFRQLLNHISHELTRQNLRSLLHICAPYVPENRREDIHCGLDLFECLIHWNIIGEDLEKMHNLLEFMREMRPKRKDIIRPVKQYIREHHQPPWGFEESTETCCSRATNHAVAISQPYYFGSQHGINDPRGSPRGSSTPLLGFSDENQYSWCCICFDCKCIPRPVPNCFLVLAIVMCVIAIIFVTIVWFCKMPLSWNEGLGEAKSPGIGAGIVCVLVLLCCVTGCMYLKRKVSPAQNPLPSLPHYCSSVEFPNNSMTSGSARSLPYVTTNIRHKKRRRSSTSTVPVGSVTTVDSIPNPIPYIPHSTGSIPPTISSQMSYPDDCHDNILTEEEGTSGDYPASGEESEGPLTVVMN